MTNLKKIAAACAVAASLAAGSAAAEPILLDFEGIADFAAINDFYNGGTDSNGASGVNYGVGFSADSIGLTDSDAGGYGTIGGMPSGVGGLTFFSGRGAVMDVGGGVETSLGFHYAAGEAGFVRVFEGLNGSGTLLGTVNLGTNISGCLDGNNLFCVFDPVQLQFAGTARSVVFGGADGWITFDDVRIGADVEEPPAQVPEPATLALSALGLAGFAAARRKARKSQ